MKELFGMSLDIIEEELSYGSARMATWFFTEYQAFTKDRFTKTLNTKLETARDVEEVSAELMRAVIEGEITFNECQKMQEALARHAVLAGIRRIEDLTAKIDDMEQNQKRRKVSGANGLTPVWGRLNEK
jgi:hypothetical protein